MTHVCPTYQAAVNCRLLMASAEAEQEKRKMDRLEASRHFGEVASSSLKTFEKKAFLPFYHSYAHL